MRLRPITWLLTTSVPLRVHRTWRGACAQGVLVWAVLCRFAHAAQRRFGATTATFFCLVTAAQFHLPFYASRTLPNVAAFVPVVTALAHWIDGTELWLVPVLLTAATVILRCDMVIVAACVSLAMLLTRRIGMPQLMLTGACSAAASVAVTCVVDSRFWGRWLWPEAELFWFNAVLGKCAPPATCAPAICRMGELRRRRSRPRRSGLETLTMHTGAVRRGCRWISPRLGLYATSITPASRLADTKMCSRHGSHSSVAQGPHVARRSREWGVMPGHWYFTRALPRALLVAYPLAAMGFRLERRVRVPLAAVTAVVTAFSALGHKEVRLA